MVKESEDSMKAVLDDAIDEISKFALHGNAPCSVLAYLNFVCSKYYALKALDE